jgi:microcin C transport system permease protein
MNPITQKRIKRFKQIKRGYYSFVILFVLFVVSLFSELIANNYPLIVKYNGKYYFPFIKFYSGKTFNQNYYTEPDYKELSKLEFNKKNNFAIFPIIPYGYNESLDNLPTEPPSAPTKKNILGTDDRGRDLFTRLLYGFRMSMTFALIILAITIILGSIIGGVQGYFGGRLDITCQRLIEVFMSLPFLYIIILLANVFNPGFGLLIFVYSIFAWIGISFYIRAEVLRARKMEYVLAAQVLGASRLRIIFKHILPNVLTPIITFAPFSVSAAIIGLASLDYLGFGIPAPEPSWGELISQGLANLRSWWLSIFPIAILFFTLLLINFIGEAIRETFDPKTHTKLY